MEEKKQKQNHYQMPSSLPTKILSDTIEFITETLSFLSSLSSNPLFSIFITFYTLILLYFPKIFFNLIFSPILITTAILLSTLLRLGSSNSTQILEKQDFPTTPEDKTHKWITCETETEYETQDLRPEQKPILYEGFVEWNVRAPLEVIYEEHEGQEEEEAKNDKKEEKEEIEEMGIRVMEGMVSLSIYYPESDTGSSSEGDFPEIEGWDSPESMCFRWEEEDKDDGLIEIELNGKRELSFQVEEENLIEIDISPVGM